MLIGQELGRLALTGDLHDLEGHGGFKPVTDQRRHDAVARADDVGNRTGAVFDQILRVAEPDIRAVGEARDLDEVGEILRLRVHQHLPDEGRAHLREREGAGLAVDLFRRDAQRFRGLQQAVHLLIAHRHIQDADAGRRARALASAPVQRSSAPRRTAASGAQGAECRERVERSAAQCSGRRPAFRW
jgi:hypothetical protein